MAANHVTPLALELDGKNPNVVFPDADLGKARKSALFAAFQNARIKNVNITLDDLAGASRSH